MSPAYSIIARVIRVYYLISEIVAITLPYHSGIRRLLLRRIRMRIPKMEVEHVRDYLYSYKTKKPTAILFAVTHTYHHGITNLKSEFE